MTLDTYLEQPIEAFPSVIWKCSACGRNLKGNRGEVYCAGEKCGRLNVIPATRA